MRLAKLERNNAIRAFSHSLSFPHLQDENTNNAPLLVNNVQVEHSNSSAQIAETMRNDPRCLSEDAEMTITDISADAYKGSSSHLHDIRTLLKFLHNAQQPPHWTVRRVCHADYALCRPYSLHEA